MIFAIRLIAALALGYLVGHLISVSPYEELEQVFLLAVYIVTFSALTLIRQE